MAKTTTKRRPAEARRALMRVARRRDQLAFLWVGVTVVGLTSCGLLPRPEQEPVAFEVPRDAFPEFLEAPWPSDVLRVVEDGQARLILRPFPNPFESSVLDEYLQTFAAMGSYAPSAGMYFHVPAGLDASSLPTGPAASLEPGSSMFLLDLDGVAGSNEDWRRLPIEWQVETEGTSFLPVGAVSVFPLLGAVPSGRSALIVTSSARAANGKPLGPSADLLKLMRCEAIEGTHHEVDCAPYQELAELVQTELGLPPEDIALIQILTLSDPAQETLLAADAARDFGPPMVTHEGPSDVAYNAYVHYEGSLGLAQYQAGAPPFDTYDGVEGGFVYDADGRPEVQRVEDVRFTLTVPIGQPPPDGWPVVVMSHGTGGSLTSGLGNGASAEAHQFARAGWAMLATSEPLHLTREGYREGSEEILTFNFLNPVAGRDIWRQSALEKVQMVSAVAGLDLTAEQSGSEPIGFDENRVAFFGHSQGGIVGAVFVAVEHRIQGAFLSGAGAGFAPSLIEKEEPVRIGDVVATLLNLPPEERLDRFHPLLTLLQLWVDPSDPVNYGQLWRHREAERTPHLAVTSGLTDQFTPKRNHGGLAGAFGLPLVPPIGEPVEVLEVLKIEPTAASASGNLNAPDGEPLSGGLLQYPNQGHFAVYYDDDAQDAYRHFFETLRTNGVPTLRTRVP